MNKVDGLKRVLAGGEQESWAGVGVVLHPVEDDLEVLLVRRATVEGDPWSGDMAFPGGKRASCDTCLLDTVRREVMEETGIDLTDAEILGYFPSILTSIRPGSTVLPVLFLVKERPEVHVNSELDAYVWTHLRDLPAKKTKAVVKGRESSVFDLGEYKVWGLTFKMLEAILHMVEDPSETP